MWVFWKLQKMTKWTTKNVYHEEVQKERNIVEYYDGVPPAQSSIYDLLKRCDVLDL
jgi:hypothetical protein